MEFGPHMPVAAAERLVEEHDARIWRVLEPCVVAARAGLDLAPVTGVAVDGTSARRGRDCVSIELDLDQPRVVYAPAGRDLGDGGAWGRISKRPGATQSQPEPLPCTLD